MYQDAKNTYSFDQAITVTADSTNTINQGAANEAEKEQFLNIVVTEAFSGGTSVAIDLEHSADNSTYADLLNIPAISTANLTLGTVIYRGRLPQGLKQYSRLEFTVVGTYTAGKVRAQLVPNVPIS